MSPTHEKFLDDLEKAGVGKVKELIATNMYPGGLRDRAQGWVDRKEAASNAEQLALARQANAAAQNSNRIAIAASVVAVISLIVALFKH